MSKWSQAQLAAAAREAVEPLSAAIDQQCRTSTACVLAVQVSDASPTRLTARVSMFGRTFEIDINVEQRLERTSSGFGNIYCDDYVFRPHRWRTSQWTAVRRTCGAFNWSRIARCVLQQARRRSEDAETLHQRQALAAAADANRPIAEKFNATLRAKSFTPTTDPRRPVRFDARLTEAEALAAVRAVAAVRAEMQDSGRAVE